MSRKPQRNSLTSAQRRELLARAAEVRERAYAPYSEYRVGAAVLGASGKVYDGCNVENASYGLTVCAERNAIFRAIADGEQEFVALAVVTENGGSPCGACRQVAYEFMSPSAPVILSDAGGKTRAFRLGELLRDGFSPRKLRQGQRAAAQHKRRARSR